MDSKTSLTEVAINVAQERGIARARDFRAAGVPPSYLTRLCEQGRLIRLARGLYQLSERDEIAPSHTLAEAARLAPGGVVSLLSALQLHGLTTQLPHAVWMSFPHKARAPAAFPFSAEIVRASGEAFAAGRTSVAVEGVDVPVYNAAKTIVDCFKYRSRVGLDVAIEALRDGLQTKKATRAELWRYAEICRVQNVMRPHLETLA